MKLNDYWRLAKISLKSRKKATRSTVRGMSISLIIIVPLIFAMISVYGSILPQLNTNPEALYATFRSSQKDVNVLKAGDKKFNFIEYNYGQTSSGGIQYLSNAVETIENSGYEMLHYTILNKIQDSNSGSYDENGSSGDKRYYERITIDGVKDDNGNDKKYPLKNKSLYTTSTSTSIAVIDKNDLNEFKKPKYMVFGDNYNSGFKNDGARQVIVSNRYLQMAGLTAEEVYGKKISVYLREDFNWGGDVTANDVTINSLDHYLFRDFEVVGVVGKVQDLENEFGYYSTNSDITQMDLIISSSSYYNQDNKPAIVPSFTMKNQDNYNSMSYDFGDVNAKNELAYKYLFTGVKSYTAYSYVAKEEDTTKTLHTIERHCYRFVPDKGSVNPYGQLNKVLADIYPAYQNEYETVSKFRSYGPGSDFYTNFLLINNILTYAMIGGLSFAGIILFAALVNLFNTIMHSVSSRKNYLGVMRAIGARSNTIPKLYLFEVLRVFTRAFIWIAILGGGICIGLKILFDHLFKGGLAFEAITISISWASIPLALLVVMAILLIIGLAYSIGCSWRMSRKPIMEVLEG